MATDERTTGVILRTRLLTESSLIVHWLTPNLGRLATVAKGARRPRSPFRSKLDLFYVAAFSLVRSRRSDLHTLRDLDLLQSFPRLRTDYARLQTASLAARLIEATTEIESPVPELYQLLLDLLAQLTEHPAVPAQLLAFGARLLALSGTSPIPHQTPLPIGTQTILHQLLHAPWPLVNRLRLDPDQTTSLARLLDRHVQDAFGIRAAILEA